MTAIDKYFEGQRAEAREERRQKEKYFQYGFMAFMALILMKFLTASMAAKRNEKIKRNELYLKAKMSIAARGGGGSNK